MSSGPAFVYFTTIKDGKPTQKLVSPDGLTRSKLCAHSKLAASHLGWGYGSGKQELVLDGEIFDEAATSKILRAMVNNDIAKPTPLTVEGLKITSFDELLTIFRIGYDLRLTSSFRGEDIRNTIVEGIKKRPLRFKRFQQVIETLYFDAGLVKLVKNHVVWGEVKGGPFASDEFYMIRQYAIMHEAQYGLWSELEAIRIDVEQRIKAANEESKKAPNGKESYSVAFPPLPGKK